MTNHEFTNSIFNPLSNPCSVTKGHRDALVNHEKAYLKASLLTPSDTNRRNLLGNI